MPQDNSKRCGHWYPHHHSGQAEEFSAQEQGHQHPHRVQAYSFSQQPGSEKPTFCTLGHPKSYQNSRLVPEILVFQ